jgi:hypothetical protein
VVYNILNGDALAHGFREAEIQGEIIVAREAFIDGDLSGDTLPDFWSSRAQHHASSKEDYHNHVVKEFETIINAPNHSTFNLWFEYDLFCQVNMWFVLSILNDLPTKKKVYAVYTTHVDKTNASFWNGFGSADPGQLRICFENRIPLHENDLRLGSDLWKAYKSNNREELTHLSKNPSSAFPHLQEVIAAHIARFPTDGSKGRPEKVIEDITRTISTDLSKVMTEFWKRESIYGFGDSQIKSIYQKVMGLN